MKYTREYLKNLILQSVRDIARKIGVRAPTLYTKLELIELVLKVQNGEIEPYFSNRGRKILKKDIASIDEFVKYKSKFYTDRTIALVIELIDKFKEELIKILEKETVNEEI